MGNRPEETPVGVDVDIIDSVVTQYPVRCVVLYGSQVRGTATDNSDVDIAVGFQDGLSEHERLELRVELTTELGKELGTDDVDVADLDDVRPEVGKSALETGIVLVGDDETVESYHEEFEERAVDETHEERMHRFDGIIDRLEGRV